MSKIKIWLIQKIKNVMNVRVLTARRCNEINEEPHLFYMGSTSAGLGVSPYKQRQKHGRLKN